MTDQHIHTHAHRWAGILLVALIRIYDRKSRLRMHRIGMTYVVRQQWKWKENTKFLFIMLHKFCIVYNTDGSD